MSLPFNGRNNGGGKMLAINPLFLNSGALGMVAPDSSDMAAFVSPRKAGRLNLRLDKDGEFTQPCRVSSAQNKCIFYSYPKFLFNFFLPIHKKKSAKSPQAPYYPSAQAVTTAHVKHTSP